MNGNFYLLIGKERLLKQEFIQDLKNKFFKSPSDASLNTQEWDLSENSSIEGLLDFIRTAPFLSEKRIAILRSVEELDKDDQENMLEALKGLPPTSILVFVSEEASTKKSAFLRNLEGLCVFVACHAPFEKDLPGWIEQRVRKVGGTIDRISSRNMMERVGKDTLALQNAIEELLLYIHPRAAISSQDIDKLLGKTSEEDIFAIADDLFQRNQSGALEKVELLFNEGVRALEVVGVLAGQLERMKLAADLLGRGATPLEVAGTLRVHSFFQQKFFLQLKKTSKASIVKLQKKLLEVDLSIKEGRQSERLALEKFILES